MDTLYNDIFIYICIFLSKRDTLNLLSAERSFHDMYNNDFFKGVLSIKLIDMKLMCGEYCHPIACLIQAYL